MATAAEQRKAEERERKYQREVAIKFYLSLVGYVTLFFLSAFLIMIVSGQTFQPILDFFGLRSVYNPESGVYANCSRPENRNNKFCRRDYERAEESWQDVLKGGAAKPVPFALSTPDILRRP